MKNILITGGTGSLGSRLVESLLQRRQALERIVVFSRTGEKQQALRRRYPVEKYPELQFYTGDLRNFPAIDEACRGIDTVIHTAAFKLVGEAEKYPGECIGVNIDGTKNLLQAAKNNHVETLLAVSTDKACAPVNLYGATKLAAEKLIVAAAVDSIDSGTSQPRLRYSAVRLGNILGTEGTVLPFFMKRRDEGASQLTITDFRMTRFNTTPSEAVDIILHLIPVQLGGEIFAPITPSYHITDLATAVAPEIPQVEIGLRPGEKIHEDMITHTDALNTLSFPGYYVLIPAMCNPTLRQHYLDRFNARPVDADFSYTSANNTLWETVPTLRSKIASLYQILS